MKEWLRRLLPRRPCRCEACGARDWVSAGGVVMCGKCYTLRRG